MHFCLWFLDFNVNAHSTTIILYCAFFNINVSTETKFLKVLPTPFKTNLFFFLLLQSTNIHYLGPQITALYHCTLMFQKEMLTLIQFIASLLLLVKSALQDYLKESVVSPQGQLITQNFPFFLLTSPSLLFCSLYAYS